MVAEFSPKLFQGCNAIQFKVMREIFAILNIKTFYKLKIVKRQSQEYKNPEQEKWN